MPDENYRRAHYVVSEWLDKVSPFRLPAYVHADSHHVAIFTIENEHQPLHAEST